jgi:hypothetical protein
MMGASKSSSAAPYDPRILWKNLDIPIAYPMEYAPTRSAGGAESMQSSATALNTRHWPNWPGAIAI